MPVANRKRGNVLIVIAKGWKLKKRDKIGGS
jgi:hypothetical protein